MNRCPNCKINTSQNHCPLCNKEFTQSDKKITDYPVYKIDEHKVKKFFAKLLLFIAISCSLILIFVNVFTLSIHKNAWSVIASASLITCVIFFNVIKSKRLNTGGKIFRLYVTVCLFLIIVDSLSGFLKWSTTYVVPFMTIAVAIVFTIIAKSARNRMNEYFGYILATAFISIIPLILYIMGLTTKLWSSLAAVLCCVIIAVFLFIFSEDNLKNEVRKRFHI